MFITYFHVSKHYYILKHILEYKSDLKAEVPAICIVHISSERKIYTSTDHTGTYSYCTVNRCLNWSCGWPLIYRKTKKLKLLRVQLSDLRVYFVIMGFN